ncbi:MAG: hypothetical protein ACRDK7_15765 [Solirubrobacteraceae bacterium]
MTDHSPLERRYRRWLALYPRSFRAEREDEMISVLMQSAGPEQTRPRPSEAADLATHGLRRRASVGRFPSRWERAHANVMFPVRILIALWLCFISAMLIGYHRSEVWLLLLVPAILLHVYIAYRIRPGAIPR